MAALARAVPKPPHPHPQSETGRFESGPFELSDLSGTDQRIEHMDALRALSMLHMGIHIANWLKFMTDLRRV